MNYSRNIGSLQSKSLKNIRINFEGGDLSTDAGLFLIHEFVDKIGFEDSITKFVKFNDSRKFAYHTNFDLLLQKAYQIIAGYDTDDHADELTCDPALTTILSKERLASQPSISRFFGRLNETTVEMINDANLDMLRKVYLLKKPQHIILDIDSTLFQTFGVQVDAKFNYHYQDNGYHPLLVFDGLTGDLLRIQLRGGTDYCCLGAVDFLKPLLEFYKTNYPDVHVFLRGDSGFASNEIYELIESYGYKYCIRMKSNAKLQHLSEPLSTEIMDELNLFGSRKNVKYGELTYRASSWKVDRCVSVKCELKNELIPSTTYIVSNMDSKPANIVRFYCKRGNMENFIKEFKNGFFADKMSSHDFKKNENKALLSMLTYNLINWFKRLCWVDSNITISTLRTKLVKIAARVIHKSRYKVFKFSSSYPYKNDFVTSWNITQSLRC